MPLKGPICCCTGQPEPFEHCMARSRTGECTHSLPLLHAMQLNAQRRAGIGISSSVLSMCPRQYVLGERHDYHEDPKDYYPRWRGAFGHYAIEMGGPYPGIIQELRFYRDITVDGVDFALSGQPDWVDINAHHIDDSKFVSYRPKAERAPYRDHERQINVYHWLLTGGYIKAINDTKFFPGEASDWPDAPDWWRNPVPKGWRAETASITYRDAKGEMRVPVDLWNDEAVERYIVGKLTPHADYIKNGNMAVLRLEPSDSWKADYCPFRHGCNPGRCCMDASRTVEKAPQSDWDPWREVVEPLDS